MYNIRKLESSDYYKGYIQLLEQLTIVGNIEYEDFKHTIDNINSHVYVIEYENAIIASGTIFIEQKIIHGLKCVGHIEDIIIDKKYRGSGIGRIIINHLVEIGKNNNCYKIILNCSHETKNFYKKIGFNDKNIEMSLYI